jgi:hypothetical protein
MEVRENELEKVGEALAELGERNAHRAPSLHRGGGGGG